MIRNTVYIYLVFLLPTYLQHLAIKNNDWKQNASFISRIIQYYSGDSGRAMVFCETKKDVDELAMCENIRQAKEKLHGDVKQSARESVLQVKLKYFHLALLIDMKSSAFRSQTIEKVGPTENETMK